MKILLIGSFEHPIYAPAFADGFRDLGHEVKCIDYDDYLYSSSKIGTFLTKFQTKYHIGYKLRRYNSDILDVAKHLKPDFIFLYRCYNVWPSTVKALKGQGMTIMTYNNDDPFSNVPSKSFFRNFMAILPMADINFIYRKKNIVDYHSIGDKNPRLLLPYYLKRDNFAENIEKDIPVAFIGHYEADGRDAYINALVKAGMPISLFNGSYWDRAPLYDSIKSIIRPAVRGREYNHALNRCQIALVFLSKINSDTYTRRCFEIPATRTLMLSEYTDDLNEMFPDGECAVYFRSPEELVQKCQWLLANPDEIIRIAENGYQRVKQLGGSETDRCQQIIDCYQQLK